MKRTLGKTPTPFVCSFCGKNQQEVKRLIAGPDGVYICDECIVSFEKEFPTLQHSGTLHCSFCGKNQQQVQHLDSGPNNVQICNECVTLCLEIITENERFKGQQNTH